MKFLLFVIYEDYENYKKLRPTKIYQRKKVRFICRSCQNEFIKGNTCLEKYGYENPMFSNEIKEKMFNTKRKRYGNPYYTGINIGTIFSKFKNQF